MYVLIYKDLVHIRQGRFLRGINRGDNFTTGSVFSDMI